MDSVSLIKDKTGSELFNSLISYLKENSSDDESFEKALRGNVYDDNPDATRFILCYYEEKYMNVTYKLLCTLKACHNFQSWWMNIDYMVYTFLGTVYTKNKSVNKGLSQKYVILYRY